MIFCLRNEVKILTLLLAASLHALQSLEMSGEAVGAFASFLLQASTFSLTL